MIAWVKKILRHRSLSQRFPYSTIHFGAEVDNESTLGRYVVLFPEAILYNSSIDNYSYVQQNSILSSVNVGKYCSIAGNVHLGLAVHPTDFVSTSPVFYDNTQPLPFFFTSQRNFKDVAPETIISADVWVGQGAMVKAGLNVGVGAVIGAGAVVTKDVEPYSVVAGVPAKHIKWRFTKCIREQLLQSVWWDLSDEEIQRGSTYIEDPVKFLALLEKGGFK